MPLSRNRDLAGAAAESLDDLLAVLRLEATGEDRFRIPAAAQDLFGRIYGGQLLAQALVGAGTTVEGKGVNSLHAAFVKAGAPGRPVEVAVTRVRDGRSMATREVTVLQDGAPLLVAFASFHANSSVPDWQTGAPGAPSPEETPLIQDWAQQAHQAGRRWIERPPPVELRVPEAPIFLGGTGTSPTRSHWMRLPRPVEGDQMLHAALLAYASDMLLMDMVFRAHPGPLGNGLASGFSVDHAIWFHRPTRFDGWHLYTQEAVTVFGERGLTRGAIHDHAGRLVASVMQEVLVRPWTSR